MAWNKHTFIQNNACFTDYNFTLFFYKNIQTNIFQKKKIYSKHQKETVMDTQNTQARNPIPWPQ